MREMSRNASASANVRANGDRTGHKPAQRARGFPLAPKLCRSSPHVLVRPTHRRRWPKSGELRTAHLLTDRLGCPLGCPPRSAAAGLGSMRAGEGNRTPIFGLGSQRLSHWTTPAGTESVPDADTLATVRMRVFWPVTVAAAALVGLLAYGLVSKGADTTLDDAVAKGKRPAAPMTALPRLQARGDGSLADYKGKVVVLNVWASWCEPCREEVPLLQKTHERIAPKGGLVLCLDTADASGKAVKFLKDMKASFPSLRDRDR